MGSGQGHSIESICLLCASEMMWRDLIDFAVLRTLDSVAAVSQGASRAEMPFRIHEKGGWFVWAPRQPVCP